MYEAMSYSCEADKEKNHDMAFCVVCRERINYSLHTDIIVFGRELLFLLSYQLLKQNVLDIFFLNSLDFLSSQFLTFCDDVYYDFGSEGSEAPKLHTISTVSSDRCR
jgi:hypothetical protein